MIARLFLNEIRLQQKIFWRSREAAGFTFLLPILLFLMLGAIYGNSVISKEHVKGSYFLEAGMIGYGIASTAFGGLAIGTVIRRESGILKRVRATPLPAWVYLGSLLVSTLITYLIEVAIIIGLGRVVFHVPVPGTMLSLLAALALGTVAFAALGLALTGAVRSSDGSSAVVNLVYLPMTFLSGTFFSTQSSPRFLRWIAEVLPLTYFTRIVRNVLLHGQHVWSDLSALGIVALWGAVGVAIALKVFRWQPREG